MTTDPISDMLIRLKNGSAIRREAVAMPFSKVKNAIGEALVKSGFVASIVKRPKKVGAELLIGLLYEGGKSKIKGVERVSKPSKRVYVSVKEIRKVKEGHGALILSTPKGILTDKEAKRELVGGEALFKIW
ncbi:30S ribosomal protein S8 [Candidatus Parcubacteria bacterium]|nr:30S ribosomal protein S8 [Candidatus Parcubacteria bacterium]